MAEKPFASFPLIQAAVDEAADKIGFQRAVIGLQGLVHQHRRLRYIDGLVREELHRSIGATLAVMKEIDVANALTAKLKSRFPNEFAEPVEIEPEISDEPIEATPKSTRRVR